MQHDTGLLNLDELLDIYHGAELQRLLLQVRQHLAQDSARIESEAAAGAFVDCRASTHRLKSMLMFLSGERLRPAFERLEGALQHDPDQVGPALQQLRGRLAQFGTELETALRSLD